MSVNFKPIAGSQNRVVIEPSPSEEKTASGIFIPDTAKEKPLHGSVVSVSDEDEKGNKPKIKAGDKVFYGQYAGTEIKLDDKKYLIMRESDIFGVIGKN
jgi:chaperonin GroES